VTKVDDKTVRLNMSEPFAPSCPRSRRRRQHLLEGELREVGQGANQHPLGTGAFILESWQKGSQLSLTKNPNYWQPGKPEG
jgi:peptide/nickel transport system substrate-binding protein